MNITKNRKVKIFLLLLVTNSMLDKVLASSSNPFQRINIPSPFGNSTTGNTGNSRQQYGVEKSSMNPIPVDVMNIPDFGDSVTTAFLNSYTYSSTATTAELYPVLSSLLSRGITDIIESQPNPLNSETAVSVLTGTPLASPYSSDAVVNFNLTDMVSHVFNCVVYPITSSVDQALQSGSVQSVFANQVQYSTNVASINYNNCKTTDQNNSYNSSSNIQTASLNINNILSAQEGSNLTTSTGWTSALITNELQIAQLESCRLSLKIQSGSSSSSGGGNVTNTNASTYGNVAGNTLVLCSIPQAACMITNIVNNILPSQMTALDNYIPGTQKTLKELNPVSYNNLTKDYSSKSISTLQASYNMSTNNTSCLGANSSSYSNAPSSANLQSDIQTVVNSLKQADKEIVKIVKKQIAKSILQTMKDNQGNNNNNQSNDIPQMYTITSTADIDTLLGHNSLIGTPNKNYVCTLKPESPSDSTITQKRLAIEASALVNDIAGLNNIINPIIDGMPFGSSIAAMGGGFGSIDNTSNMSSSDATTIDTNRTNSLQSYNSNLNQFNTSFSSYVAMTSPALGILNDIQNSRQNSIPIPTFMDSSGNIMNPANSSTTPGYISAGEICTSKEIDNFDASYRVKGIVNSSQSVTTNAWQQSVAAQTNVGYLNKEEVLLLAEIRLQLFRTQKQLEHELVLESLNNLNSLTEVGKELATINSDIDKAIKSFITGGGGSSGGSSGLSGN